MIYSYLALVISLVWVLLVDILNLCFSLLRIRSLVLFSRSLLPRYVIPSLSTLLNETQQLLERAEAIGAIPPENDYRALLDLCEDYTIVLMDHHLTFTQIGKSICNYAYGEQSCSRELPAAAPCDTTPPDLQVSCPLLPNRGH
jgi:hypothetical protein